MALNTKFPMKFICPLCQRIYLFRFKNDVVFYPACPLCTTPGKLLGLSSRLDLFRYPKAFLKTYLV